jgi:uncharacterized protein (TIGR00106 family)
VARALDILEGQETVSYELTPMGTILEGDLDALLGVVRRMHESAFDGEVQRVLTRVAIDDRRDRPSSMESKVRSVETKLRKK